MQFLKFPPVKRANLKKEEEEEGSKLKSAFQTHLFFFFQQTINEKKKKNGEVNNILRGFKKREKMPNYK